MVEYSSKKSRTLKINKYWNKKCVIKRYCSNNYIDTSATQFVLECYKAQEMCDKNLILAPLYLIVFVICIRLKKISDKIAPKPFMLKYCLGRYNTQEICDKDVDASLPGLKFVSN